MIHFKLHSYLVASLFSGCCLWFAACSEDPGLPVEITDPIEVPSDDGKIVIEIPAGGLQIPRCKVLFFCSLFVACNVIEYCPGLSAINSSSF